MTQKKIVGRVQGGSQPKYAEGGSRDARKANHDTVNRRGDCAKARGGPASHPRDGKLGVKCFPNATRIFGWRVKRGPVVGEQAKPKRIFL